MFTGQVGYLDHAVRHGQSNSAARWDRIATLGRGGNHVILFLRRGLGAGYAAHLEVGFFQHAARVVLRVTRNIGYLDGVWARCEEDGYLSAFFDFRNRFGVGTNGASLFNIVGDDIFAAHKFQVFLFDRQACARFINFENVWNTSHSRWLGRVLLLLNIPHYSAAL